MRSKLLCVLACIAAAGCRSKDPAPDDRPVAGREERALLAAASELTLFAIDPHRDASGPELHGFPIRKTVTIPREEIPRVAGAVASGLGRGPEANCFEPHHALRVASMGQSLELVICFACSEVEVYRGGQRVGWLATDGTAEAILARYLGPTPDPDDRW